MLKPPRLAFKYQSGDELTLTRSLCSLRDSSFYAGTREPLNDPFEGRFTRTDLDMQFDGVKAVVASLSDGAARSLDSVSNALNELLAFVDKCGIFSLSYNPLNELIWAHYGGSHKGFCIGYDLEKLLSFESTQRHCLDVIYEDSAPSVQVSDLVLENSPLKVLQKILGTKSSPWQYEQEVRIITTPPGHHEHDFRAVKEVYFGLRCPYATRLAVMQALAGRNVKFKQVTSPHPSYLMATEELLDTFAFEPTYKQNLAPIAEHAILTSHLKAELKQYTHYLSKAAEIVRRDPYCPLVETVDFSSSQSTAQSPVIYAQYQRAPNKWITRHFTLAEIDIHYNALSSREKAGIVLQKVLKVQPMAGDKRQDKA